MNSIRTMLTAFTMIVLPCLFAQAEDQPAAKLPPAGESFAAVNKAWQDALAAQKSEFLAAREAAKKKGDAALKAFKFDKLISTATISSRFLAIAERNPEGPDAVEALGMALRTSYDFQNKKPLETQGKALELLHRYHVTNPQIKKVAEYVIHIDTVDARKLVDEVIARNPDRQVRFVVCRALIATREAQLADAERIEQKPKFREFLETNAGKDEVTRRLAAGAKAKPGLEELKKTFREEFSDLLVDLSVGNSAPEVLSHDLEGKEVRLSSLKGKIAVLDIWATWCGPCKAMIPHEREMVARLKDKPFVLVSISIDEDVKTLKDFLTKEPMPWTHWWSGNQGGISEDWNIASVPSIFVLDSHGIIRFRDIRGDELEKAVNVLLEEIEPKKSASR